MTPPAPAVAPVAPVTMPAGAPVAAMPPVLTVPSPPVVVAYVVLPADALSVAGTALPAVPMTVPPPAPLICPSDPFKLPVIPDVKSYLNLTGIIQYYLWRPEFSTQRSDDELITDSWNAEASSYWEGQLRVALQDGSLCYLFKHKGSMYNGKGSKMLAALNLHCRPDTVHDSNVSLQR